MTKFSDLDTITQQAIGYFILGWKEEDAPAITKPYKYRYTENRALDVYPEWSKLMLDNEFALAAAVEDMDNPQQVFTDISIDAQRIIEQYTIEQY